MVEPTYKFGVRVEPYSKGVFLGLGFTWFTEKALQIDVLFWSVTVGKVYDMG